MKTIYLLSVVCLVASCAKDKTSCWSCDVTMPGSSQGTYDTTTTICNVDKSYIKELEDRGTYKCKKQ